MPRPTAIAIYPSRCGGCDETIHAGDPIALDEPEGEWLHAHCAELEGSWPDDEDEELAA